MLTAYNCLVYEHDLRLVALAVLVCAFASFTAISLLHHVRKSTGPSGYVWLAVCATAAGFGIWATHSSSHPGLDGRRSVRFVSE